MSLSFASRGALVAAALVATGCGQTPESSAAQVVKPPAAGKAANISQSRQTAITVAVARVAPAVVTVQTVSTTEIPPDFFFGGGGTRVTPGLGSGFIVQPNGVIVTNAHVVAGADSVSVMLRDGTVYPAKVLGADGANDVAVIKIDAKNLPVVKLGNSTSLAVGEWAIAIGNPYGFALANSEPSVTAGVISGVGRNVAGQGAATYVDMIQTDASINPGNSGGPLINADGEVVGVNSSIFTPSGGSVGLGFAIPIERVARVVDDLLTHGEIRRPWIGVSMQGASANPRDLINRGAMIVSVADKSPAAEAGLEKGDIVIQLGMRQVKNAFDWQAALLDLRVGESAPVTVRRGTKTIAAHVTVADLPDVAATKVSATKDIQLVSVTPSIQAEHQLAVSSGALIFSVTDAITRDIGLAPNDVIVGINNVEIKSAEDAKRMFDRIPNRQMIQMEVIRGNRRLWAQFYLQK